MCFHKTKRHENAKEKKSCKCCVCVCVCICFSKQTYFFIISKYFCEIKFFVKPFNCRHTFLTTTLVFFSTFCFCVLCLWIVFFLFFVLCVFHGGCAICSLIVFYGWLFFWGFILFLFFFCHGNSQITKKKSRQINPNQSKNRTQIK